MSSANIGKPHPLKLESLFTGKRMSAEKRTRISDIAEKVGMSMMTVSRALSNDPKVSITTREKIMQVAKELNYRPNVSARRLASNKSFFIGLLYNNPSASYVSQFLLGALKKCRESGHHLVVDEVVNEEGEKSALALVMDLVEVTQVDGMILLPPLSDSKEIIDLLIKEDIPFVRIAPDTNLGCSHYVCMDDYQAGFDVTEQLIREGHTRIAHIIGHPNQGASRLRYQGFLDAMRSNQLDVPPEYIEQGFFTYKSGLDAAEKLLDLTDRPTAIFAGNDDMAAAVLSAANKRNLSVPEALSVVGFDDTQISTTVWPHLTTVRQPITEMAQQAVALLAEGVAKKPSQQSHQGVRHTLDFELITRGSTVSQ